MSFLSSMGFIFYFELPVNRSSLSRWAIGVLISDCVSELRRRWFYYIEMGLGCQNEKLLEISKMDRDGRDRERDGAGLFCRSTRNYAWTPAHEIVGLGNCNL